MQGSVPLAVALDIARAEAPAPVPVTPKQIAAAIDQLLDENESLKRQLAAAKITGKIDVPGFQQNRPKLNKREVTAIRALSRNGETNREIADIYQINPSTVSRIVRGVYWK